MSASLLFGVLAWEVLGRASNASFIAPFSTTMVRLWEMIVSGDIAASLLGSLWLFLAGFLLAIVVGVPLGLLIARSRRLRIATEGYITVVYSIPTIALIPFILSAFGFGFGPKVLVVFIFAVFPVLYNTTEGARSINQEYLDVARAFRSSERRLWLDLLIPFVLPFALAGARQAIGRSLVGVIAAEMFLGASGIGSIIASTSQNFDMPGLLATVLMVTLLGVAMMTLGEIAEKRFVRWRNTGDE